MRCEERLALICGDPPPAIRVSRQSEPCSHRKRAVNRAHPTSVSSSMLSMASIVDWTHLTRPSTDRQGNDKDVRSISSLENEHLSAPQCCKLCADCLCFVVPGSYLNCICLDFRGITIPYMLTHPLQGRPEPQQGCQLCKICLCFTIPSSLDCICSELQETTTSSSYSYGHTHPSPSMSDPKTGCQLCKICFCFIIPFTLDCICPKSGASTITTTTAATTTTI